MNSKLGNDKSNVPHVSPALTPDNKIIPTVVISMNSGAIYEVFGNTTVRIIMADQDTEFNDSGIIQHVEGTECVVMDYHASLLPERVQGILKNLQ